MVRVGVVEVVGSRRAVGACEGAVGTCEGLPVVGQTSAVARRVVLGAEVEAVDTLAFEVGVAAEAQRVHCYPQSLVTYATDRIFILKKRFCSMDRPKYAAKYTYLENRLIYNLV